MTFRSTRPAPNKTAPRLYINETLSTSCTVELSTNQAHYLRDVMRLGEGASIRVFNGQDGNWLGQISSINKKKATLEIIEQSHKQRAEPNIWLAFAPIKSARLDILIEKAVELGVSHLLPVITERTQNRRTNINRIRAQVIESAEQCERMSIPEVHEPVSLPQLMEQWPADRQLWYGDETGNGETAINAFNKAQGNIKHGILVGPEGGFSSGEMDALLHCSFANSICLGPRVLRAETAAIVSLSLWQVAIGDGTHHLDR